MRFFSRRHKGEFMSVVGKKKEELKERERIRKKEGEKRKKILLPSWSGICLDLGFSLLLFDFDGVQSFSPPDFSHLPVSCPPSTPPTLARFWLNQWYQLFLLIINCLLFGQFVGQWLVHQYPCYMGHVEIVDPSFCGKALLWQIDNAALLQVSFLIIEWMWMMRAYSPQ